jgi:hypothetical protein
MEPFNFFLNLFSTIFFIKISIFNTDQFNLIAKKMLAICEGYSIYVKKAANWLHRPRAHRRNKKHTFRADQEIRTAATQLHQREENS